HQHSRLIVGYGAYEMAGIECNIYGITHALIVTTGLKGTGIVEEVCNVLKAAGVAYTIFDKVTSNPKDYEVKEGAKVYKEAKCNGIVSIGGGSAHDAGKGIRICLTNEGENTDLKKFAAVLDPHYTTQIPKFKVVNIPQVAINTTTGTGAHGTAFAIINDSDWTYKLICVVPGVAPSVGIDEPLFMRLQPNHLVAWSGMDALCHAIEPFIGRLNFPVAYATSIRAIKLIAENLREAYANPWNDKAIENLAWAQTIASMSYNMGGGMGMVHGLAHMVSVLRDAHHGYTNAIMMIPVEKFNMVACPDKFAEIAVAFGVDTKGMTKVQAADKALEEMERLRNDVGITDISLKQFNFTDADVEHTVKWALNDLSREANPRDINADDIRKIMKSMM
ncbi:MAG: iron-containing alcohol dehydrogenase, partial [Candidatus Goldbacteria bacterium]|nr:iron-containing alcohol dehydrogenase [Candidatus Goldiibacteriota bacterium]